MVSYSIVHGLTPTLIPSYDEFTQRVFHFDLSKWRQAGYWDERYVPHALVADGRIIANVSAAIMNLQIKGRTIPAVQLGAMGVLPEYRGQGLSRIVMEAALQDHGNVPLIFLFGHSGVVNFYPKFGFTPIKDAIPFIRVSRSVKTKESVHISLASEHLLRLLNSSLQHSGIIDARNNPAFYWFHLMYRFSQDIYYVKELGIGFIARYHEDAVDLYDVLSERKVTFEEIRPYVVKEATEVIRFHFTPDWLGVDYEVGPGDDDDTLFVRGEFPLEMPSFKFPVTAQT